jgi:WD40 repeat protein
MKLSPDGNLLITAGEDGGITVRTLYLYSLKRIWRYQVATPVTSLELMNGKEYLFAGLADGSVLCTIFDMSNLLSDMCTGK